VPLQDVTALFALINSVGNLAGFGESYIVGWIKDATGSTSTGLLMMSLFPLAAGLFVSRWQRHQPRLRQDEVTQGVIHHELMISDDY
jgi:nitrate/nitrite transporter NarK